MSERQSTISEPTIREQLDTTIRFLRRMLRNRRAVLGSLLVGIIACAIFFKLRVTPYRSETVLLYGEGIRAVDRTGEPHETPQTVTIRLRETLLARPLLEKTIEEFKLYPDLVKRHGYVDAVEKFREKIDFRAPGGDTFSISFTGNSPWEAQAVTKRLGERLIEHDSALRRQNAGTTRDFLEAERKRTGVELLDTEKELAVFLGEHPEFALDSMLLLPGAPQTGAAFRAADAAHGGARSSPRPTARYQRAPAASTLSPLAPVTGERAEGRLPAAQVQAARTRAETELVAARSVLLERAARYTDHHPDVQAARINVQNAEQRLKALAVAEASAQAAALPIAQATPGESPTTPVRRAYLPQPDAKANAGTKRDPDRLISLETEWSRLTRDVAESRQRHNQMETAFFKADIAANSESGGHALRIAVIDPAYLPANPVPPGKLTLIAMFLVLALIVGIGLSAGLAAIDDRFYDGRDVLRFAPVLAEIPRAESSRRKRNA